MQQLSHYGKCMEWSSVAAWLRAFKFQATYMNVQPFSLSAHIYMCFQFR